MAMTNQYMEAAANMIFEISSDENIRELCRRRAEYEAFERHQQAEIARLRNCRKISDADCAGYFFESAVQKT